MKRYALVAVGLVVLLLVPFGVVELLGVPVLSDPEPWVRRGGVVAAAVGVGFLVADVLIPVPSSFLMVAHGALFGVAAGTLLSLVGSVGAAAVAFAIGRRGGPLLHRLVGEEERARADRLLAEWGALAVLVTRPVPLLAETVAVLAGASPMGWSALFAASVLGNLPAALVYALAGAVAGTFESALLVLLLVLALTGLAWAVGRRMGRFRSVGLQRGYNKS